MAGMKLRQYLRLIFLAFLIYYAFVSLFSESKVAREIPSSRFYKEKDTIKPVQQVVPQEIINPIIKEKTPRSSQKEKSILPASEEKVVKVDKPKMTSQIPTHLTNYGRCDNRKFCVDCPTDFILQPKNDKRANAVVVVLCRSEDLDAIKKSLRSYEDNFNSRYNYPYVFLNNLEFSSSFKDEIKDYLLLLRKEFKSNYQTASIKFSMIPKKDWSYPIHITKEEADAAREITKDKYIYGGLESYRFMIRYFSGPFFHHPDLLEYDYYWRVEPDVEFYCRLDYDPFIFMSEKKILYGFNIMSLFV